MLQIEALQAKLADEDKLILHDVSLTVNPGEVHFIRGQNGSGKSTLASVLAGDPKFAVVGGKINLRGEQFDEFIREKLAVSDAADFDLAELSPEQRSWAGLFVAQQYPLEIPGVGLSNFLRLAYNFRHPTPLPVFQFRKLVREKAAILNYPEHLLDRNLNEGFSGGEKKKTEILQLALLEPRYAVLDETDSGLDPAAIKDVFTGIARLQREHLPNLALIVISHYDRVQEYLPPQFVHEMKDGVLQANN